MCLELAINAFVVCPSHPIALCWLGLTNGFSGGGSLHSLTAPHYLRNSLFLPFNASTLRRFHTFALFPFHTFTLSHSFFSFSFNLLFLFKITFPFLNRSFQTLSHYPSNTRYDQPRPLPAARTGKWLLSFNGVSPGLACGNLERTASS